MDRYPAKAENSSNDSTDAEDVDRSCGVGDVGWEDASYYAAARDDGKHVKAQFCREARGVGEFCDEEEWNIKANKAYERGEAEERKGKFLEAGEVDDGFTRERQHA